MTRLQIYLFSVEKIRCISENSEKNDKFFSLKVSIPVGATAKIYLPKIGFKKVELEESGIRIWNGDRIMENIPYITNIQVRSKHIKLNIESGTYNFRIIKMRKNEEDIYL